MSQQLAVEPEVQAPSLEGRTTPTSLNLPEGLSLEEWASLAYPLGAMARSSAWWIGDWIVHGEAFYEGDVYAQYVEDTGLARQTLLNYASTCRRVAKSVRRDDLSFAHHAAVASLKDGDEQAKWLEAAAKNDWNRDELREAVHGTTSSGAQDTGDPPRTIPMPTDRLQRAREFAADLAEKHERGVKQVRITTVLSVFEELLGG